MTMTEHALPQEFRRFLLVTGALSIAMLSLTLAINLLVDPLWHGAGNQLTHVNYAFNERLSKINLYLQRLGQYDCLILGSSRTTLLDEMRALRFEETA